MDASLTDPLLLTSPLLKNEFQFKPPYNLEGKSYLAFI